MRDRLVALTVLVVGVAIAQASKLPMAIVALVVPSIGLVVGPRLRLDRVGQAALTIGAMVFGVLVPRLLSGPPPTINEPHVLGERALLLAMPMLAVAAARTLVHLPVFGSRLTLTAALVALTAAGRALSGLSYPLLAAAAIVTGLIALYANDPVRPRLRFIGPRHIGAVVVGFVVAGAAAVGSAWSLPRLHDAALARYMARWNQARIGFSSHLELGEMRGLLDSDVVVMRVRGDAPPLVRGAVFGEYTTGRWDVGDALLPEVGIEVPVEPPEGHRLVEIENVGKPIKVYFLPLEAGDIAASSGILDRDVFGVHTPSSGNEAKRIWFTHEGGKPPLDPRPIDRKVSPRLRAKLRAVLDDWKIDQASPRARVEAISARLQQDYRYSLSFERTRGVDQVVDFLTIHREGHCEYFASALALLARTADVPTRVVAGYRVVETSPLGYQVVRERHAHSWVEVWLDDRWVTFDPTPAGDIAASSPTATPIFTALLDGVATGWERIDDWLEKRSAFEMSLMLVGLAGALLAARAWRSRARRAKASAEGDAPLQGFVRLSRALEEHGLARSPTETLTCFAQRVEREGILSLDLKKRAAELVRRYGDVRYANRGDPGALDRELSEAARVVTASSREAASVPASSRGA